MIGKYDFCTYILGYHLLQKEVDGHLDTNDDACCFQILSTTKLFSFLLLLPFMCTARVYEDCRCSLAFEYTKIGLAFTFQAIIKVDQGLTDGNERRANICS